MNVPAGWLSSKDIGSAVERDRNACRRSYEIENSVSDIKKYNCSAFRNGCFAMTVGLSCERWVISRQKTLGLVPSSINVSLRTVNQY